jgi:predicted RND superfamily exporter protein
MIARVQAVSGLNSFVTGAIVVIPFIVSTAVTLIVMMSFGIYLDIATAAIGNITVSAASDLPVFLIVRFREVLLEAKDFERSLVSDEMVDEVTRAGADVLVNALTYVPLALPFLVAFDPILNLGIMLLVALASCYVGTILALPFLRWCVSSK